jgi:hypothetical protein
MQSIQDIWSKFKSAVDDEATYTAVLVLLVAVCSFGLGRLSVVPTVSTVPAKTLTASVSTPPPAPSITIEETTPRSYPTSTPTGVDQQYVGSKNGTKFHLLTCPGASQIKEENKVYFTSKQEAYSKGYTEASNCKGI